jgi:hypothetical protein
MLEKPLSADAKKTLESVDAILPMMQRVTAAMDEAKLGLDPNEGYIKQGMQVLHGMGQQAEYSMGLDPGDPVYRELLPLIANLKVMATSPYLHGVRNMQYIQQIQSHLPSVTDSPALIRSKLWDPTQHVDESSLPSHGTMMKAIQESFAGEEWDRNYAQRLNETMY